MSDRKYTFDQFLDALEAVESGGVCNAVGDNGRSIGPLQIGILYFADAWHGQRENAPLWEECATRPAGTAKNAAQATKNSRETVRRYMKRYAGGFLATALAGTARLPSLEAMARMHNGGPKAAQVGHVQWAATHGYWEKVKAQIDKLRGSEIA